MNLEFNEIFKNSLIIAMPEDARSLQLITLNQAKYYNQKKFGIFFTVQGFLNQRRTLENLNNINAWAIDLDSGTKLDQLECLRKSYIRPSMIIETKRGHHAYWFAKDATREKYRIITDSLVEIFSADKNAKDLCRILRLPKFFHWKDQNNPFKIKVLEKNDQFYTEDQMLFFFAQKKEKPKQETRHYETNQRNNSNDFEDINCEQALKQLSGSSHINGDQIDFRQNANGTKQIYVNGKSTACWIDHNGLIGSHANGGPYIWQWLEWYGHSKNDIIEIIKEII